MSTTITPRTRNLAREAEELSKHATRCVVEAVYCESIGQIDAALKLFDKQARAEKRVRELLAMPEVSAALNDAALKVTP